MIFTSVIGLVLTMLIGLLIAFKGLDLLRGFVRLAGGLTLGMAMLFFGLVLSNFLGAIFGLVLGIGLAILGFIIGWAIAPTILLLLTSMVVFSMCWALGMSAGGHFGADGLLLLGSAFACGIVGAFLFTMFVKKLMMGATSALGAFLFAAPLYLLLSGPLGPMIAGGASMAVFIGISISGYISQHGKRTKGWGLKKKKDGGRRNRRQ